MQYRVISSSSMRSEQPRVDVAYQKCKQHGFRFQNKNIYQLEYKSDIFL